MLRRIDQLALVVFILLVLPVALMAQSDSTRSRDRDSIEARERLVKRMRAGAGVRLGSWQVRGLSQASGATSSSLPAFEAYWQKGLDRHVVLETSAGIWTRTQRAGSESVGSYVVPMLTAIKLYPMSGPENALEPFVTAGIGFTLGIDDRNDATAGGILGGGGGGGGTMLVPGFGLKAGTGVEYRLGSAFGLVAQAGYQYVRFFQDVGSDRTYKGLQLFGGMTYRFQF